MSERSLLGVAGIRWQRCRRRVGRMRFVIPTGAKRNGGIWHRMSRPLRSAPVPGTDETRSDSRGPEPMPGGWFFRGQTLQLHCAPFRVTNRGLPIAEEIAGPLQKSATICRPHPICLRGGFGAVSLLRYM